MLPLYDFHDYASLVFPTINGAYVLFVVVHMLLMCFVSCKLSGYLQLHVGNICLKSIIPTIRHVYQLFIS